MGLEIYVTAYQALSILLTTSCLPTYKMECLKSVTILERSKYELNFSDLFTHSFCSASRNYLLVTDSRGCDNSVCSVGDIIETFRH
jgi:hypothetical protein